MISPPPWFCLPSPQCPSTRPSRLHETDDDNYDENDDIDGEDDDEENYEEDDGDDDDDSCYATCAKASSIILI